MDPYILVLVAAGLLILLVAWLPMVLRELPLSLPIFCVVAGFGGFSLVEGFTPDPMRFPVFTEHLTELVVIVALTGAGVKLDRPFSFRNWGATWRLLAVAMPLSILGIALVGHWLLGFGLASALLLGAALAPTDPVLAADVQVGPPGSGEEDEVRFALTAEAGLNDGLSFPFVNLAIAAATLGAGGFREWGTEWLLTDVVWKLAAGLGVGWVVGRGLGWLMFHVPNRAGLARTGDGFLALGITFLAYGITEIAHGYGFLAVFVAAVAVRDTEREHDFHERLHDFSEQIERLLMMVLLVLLGGAVAGGLLAPLTWPDVLAVLIFVFVVRPVAGVVSLLGTTLPWQERATLAFFGIRGLGSFYYLAYAVNETRWDRAEEIWAVMGLTVVLSIALHGVTVTPVMRYLDRRRRPQGVLPLDEQA
ncbi:cation:proton antiporter [Roseomonas sp. BN140053]|uniref:cation:proton antiporter n=1 Tax=Roseomonas sp. BN140053 TaxID=3391898 RepID=UPI0039E77319